MIPFKLQVFNFAEFINFFLLWILILVLQLWTLCLTLGHKDFLLPVYSKSFIFQLLYLGVKFILGQYITWGRGPNSSFGKEISALLLKIICPQWVALMHLSETNWFNVSVFLDLQFYSTVLHACSYASTIPSWSF